MANKQNPMEKKTGHGGKIDNDVNKTGEQPPTQKNEGKRTPQSRSDRETNIGGNNQSQSRRGATPGSSDGGR